MNSPVLLGLCLTVSVSLGNITAFALFTLTEVAKGMVSVENCDEYARDEKWRERNYENGDGDAGLKNGWPRTGNVEIVGLRFGYSPSRIVLKDVSLRIKDSEKVGIIGRTGAGKSSLLKALLKLYDNKGFGSGTITIDGVDIDKIGALKLRQSIGVITQEPILLEGTIRYNLDPYSQYEDTTLDTLLTKIFPTAPTLSTEISSLSPGQRQLLTLGRLILHQPSLLLLDEATSNLDQSTEATLHSLLMRHLKRSTIIAVSHRIDWIKDFDGFYEVKDGNVVKVG